MSVKFIQSELIIELAIEQQQHLSGGRRGYLATVSSPDILVRGNLTTKEGESFPVDIVGIKRDS
ncbi:hypothetical protein [aff. Roholtiella sp. LEGE 12411]|uniref:hypothetical protein n=1 Tax=aff. Roholtiella sp. LEGE 12411 TaxID=1828822 RepID=UPI001880707C|nr:hypothetical protein [aff. Roholtiella sp. LEGE 12411]MBE9037973.1 hypothetical protein [aff. Roholtiella sp. LEGE 12411]